MSGWPLLPRTLYGRVALVIFSALALAHLLTFGAIVRERGELMRGMMSSYLVKDVATAHTLLDRLPPAERAAWLPRLARPHYDYALQPAPSATPLGAGPNAAAADVGTPDAARATPTDTLASLRAELQAELGAARIGPPQAAPEGGSLLPLALADGSTLWLRLRPPSAWLSRGTTVLLLLQLALLAAATAWGVQLAVRPLSRLARAADAAHAAARSAGPATAEPAPLPDQGPLEVQRAVRAFNAMQQRIQQQLDERMRLLADISHDLQTPITRLRLRAEQVGDAALRDKLLGDLQAMQALVEEGLAFARTAQAAQEPLQPVDLNALLDGLVCDAVEAGHPAQLSGRLDQPLITRVQALRRLLGNLIDNALKFGGPAPVTVQVSLAPGAAAPAPRLVISVLDNGPGIPPAQLEAVLQPFHRLEASRNRDTGGTGLGLAIAQQLATALGGRLSLHNRPQGGLEARLALPL